MKVIDNKVIISFICLMFLCTASRAQDIKTLIVPPKASFSGGIFASGQYYNVSGIDNRRSPYSYNHASIHPEGKIFQMVKAQYIGRIRKDQVANYLF